MPKVTFAQMQKVLGDFGFEGQPSGRHVIFRQLETGAVLTMPRDDALIRPIHIRTASRQIANAGIATIATFESRLQRAVRETAAKASA